MIRHETECRNIQERKAFLENQLNRLSYDSPEHDEGTIQVIEDLEREIANLEHQLDEYEVLKAGSVSDVFVENLNELGETLIKARIAKGLSQGELAERLDMKQQQVQRYERNDWQKISLWRLQEVVEALGIHLGIRVHLSDTSALEEERYGEPEWELATSEGYFDRHGMPVVIGNSPVLAGIPAGTNTPRLAQTGHLNIRSY